MFDNNIPGKNGPKHTLGTSKERRNTTKKIKAPSDPRGTKQSRGRRADEPQGGIYTKITGKHSNKCFVHIGECMFFYLSTMVWSPESRVYARINTHIRVLQKILQHENVANGTWYDVMPYHRHTTGLSGAMALL